MFALRLSSLLFLAGRTNPVAVHRAEPDDVAVAGAPTPAAPTAAAPTPAVTTPAAVDATTPAVAPRPQPGHGAAAHGAAAHGAAHADAPTPHAEPRGRDPIGVRVVPLRPASPWPHGRSRDRIANPFRAFPYRSTHLVRIMAAAESTD